MQRKDVTHHQAVRHIFTERKQTYVMKKWALLSVELYTIKQESLQSLRRVVACKRNVRLQVALADHEQYLSTCQHYDQLTVESLSKLFITTVNDFI